MFESFVIDPQTGVHVLPGGAGRIDYLDGAEARLGELLDRCADRSSGSDELLARARTWPLRYHVSPQRAAILDALGLPGRARRVLELGAGCGAVTRWLGENFEDVRAVEGSPARAALARRRCADLDAVHVYAGDFTALDPRAQFDLVTLIGVLEYSPAFSAGGTPRDAMLSTLRLARRALASPGALVVAIENRVGAKYLLGAPEDHTGRRWEGLQGYPRPGTAVTCSPDALSALLREAGFGASVVLPVWPDYKFPRTLACGPSDGEDLHNWIAGGTGLDGAAGRPPAALLQRELAAAGLAGQLANSLVAVAFEGEDSAEALGLDLGWSLRHYALHRRAPFRKRVTLRDGALEVERPGGDQGRVAALGVVQDLTAEPRLQGDLLVFDVLQDVAVRGPQPALAERTAQLRAWLLAEHGRPGQGDLVCPDALDMAWWNVMVDAATGRWTAFDREWSLEEPLPVDFVLWRMVRHFTRHFALDLPPGLAPGAAAFATAVLASVPGARADLAREFEALDTAVARAIAPAADGKSVEASLRAVLAAAARPPRPGAAAAATVAGRAVLGAAQTRWLAAKGARAVRHRLRVRRSVSGRAG